MDIQPSQGALFMKIGKINRLTKKGELVSVRLPNGKTISAKAGNDLTSTTVLVSKTNAGWFAFANQGETKTTSTQVVSRRPRRVTPNIYPIKVLFSIEFDDRFEFYIGGDRDIPIKIWELEKQEENAQRLTSIRKAIINSTGNKPNDWIVSIQYYRWNDTIAIPVEYRGNSSPDVIQGVESSAIITSNNITVHVGTDVINPIGNGWFAPDAFNWFNPDGNSTARGYGDSRIQRDVSNELVTGDLVVYRLRATGKDPVILYALNDIFYTTPIGTVAGFEYIPGAATFQSSMVFNLWVPSNPFLLSSPLDWNTTLDYSYDQVIGLSNNFAADFYLRAYNLTLTHSDLNLVEARNYVLLPEGPYYDVDYMRSINGSLQGSDGSSPLSSVRRKSQDSTVFNSQYSTMTKAGSVVIAGRGGGFSDYGGELGSFGTNGFFKFPMITSSGFAVQTIAYRNATTDYSLTLRQRSRTGVRVLLDVIKSSTDGVIQLLGEDTTISLDFIQKDQLNDSANASRDFRKKKVGTGESLIQKGLDNSGIGHKVEYSWEERLLVFDITFPVTDPSYAESAFYYDGTDKYSIVTTNSDFRDIIAFTVESSWIFGVPIYTGFRTAPLYKSEDILENNKISRVAWAEEDGEALKESDVKLDVKTYRIIVDGGTATIPNSSKIKTFKVKKISATPLAETAIIHSMSCYFN